MTMTHGRIDNSIRPIPDDEKNAIELIKKMESEYPLSPYKIRLEYYRSYDSYGPDPIRLRMVDTLTSEVLCEHLIPEYAHGHTYMLLAQAMRKTEKIGILNGKNTAVKEITNSLCNTVRINNLF
jgi:hypothetical protein